MAKPKIAKKPSRSSPAVTGLPEDRTTLAVTILWMLTVLATVAAEASAAALAAVARLDPPAPDQQNRPAMEAATLLLTATITGILCLVLTPLVWRIRKLKPPLAIVAAALLAGAAPLLVWAYLSLTD